MGNAGNTSAYWMGFSEFTNKPPKICCYQAGAAPFLRGKPVENPETVATAIRIGNPLFQSQVR